jgi:hypothetical protein
MLRPEEPFSNCLRYFHQLFEDSPDKALEIFSGIAEFLEDLAVGTRAAAGTFSGRQRILIDNGGITDLSERLDPSPRLRDRSGRSSIRRSDGSGQWALPRTRPIGRVGPGFSSRPIRGSRAGA